MTFTSKKADIDSFVMVDRPVIHGTLLRNPFKTEILFRQLDDAFSHASNVEHGGYILLLEPRNIKQGNSSTFTVCHRSTLVSYQIRLEMLRKGDVSVEMENDWCRQQVMTELETNRQVKGRVAVILSTRTLIWISNVDLRTFKVGGAYLEI